jgi:hypothetical protein
MSSTWLQALLAKQAWRIITRPTSLCSQVLRARYFKGGDFLTASCHKASSFTWKSIVHGRELLQEGLVWRVGCGKDIDVWGDNWIPRSDYKRPLGHKPDKVVHKVDELLLPEGQGWNEARLHELFFEGDVEDILKIPIGRARNEDYCLELHQKWDF